MAPCWPHVHIAASPPCSGKLGKRPLSRAGSAAFQRPPWCILSFLGLGGCDTLSLSHITISRCKCWCPSSLSSKYFLRAWWGPLPSQDRGGRRALPASRRWPWVPGEPGWWSACQWHYPAPHSLGDIVEGHSSVLGDTSALSACSVPPINSAPTP